MKGIEEVLAVLKHPKAIVILRWITIGVQIGYVLAPVVIFLLHIQDGNMNRLRPYARLFFYNFPTIWIWAIYALTCLYLLFKDRKWARGVAFAMIWIAPIAHTFTKILLGSVKG